MVCEKCFVVYESTKQRCDRHNAEPLRIPKEDELSGPLNFGIKVCPECALIYEAGAVRCHRHKPSVDLRLPTPPRRICSQCGKETDNPQLICDDCEAKRRGQPTEGSEIERAIQLAERFLKEENYQAILITLESIPKSITDNLHAHLIHLLASVKLHGTAGFEKQIEDLKSVEGNLSEAQRELLREISPPVPVDQPRPTPDGAFKSIGGFLRKNRLAAGLVVSSIVAVLAFHYFNKGAVQDQNTQTQIPQLPQISSISIRTETDDLVGGESREIHPVVKYTDGKEEDIDKGVTWETSDGTVAEVSEGKLRGKQVGKVKITAKYRDLESAPIEVEVKHRSWKEIKNLLVRGEQLHENGSFEKAIKTFREAEKLNPPLEQKKKIEDAIRKAREACATVQTIMGKPC
jgi:hypothetical protein